LAVNLARIAQELQCPLDSGYGDINVERLADPQDADGKSITFVSDKKYLPLAEQSKACAIIVKKGRPIAGKVCLEVDDPYVGFAKTALLFEDRSPLFDGPIHPTAVIHASARVHETVYIGPYSVIGKECVIGKGSLIGAQCVIENKTVVGEGCRIDSGAIIRRDCVIGNRVIIQSGAVIGGEGFGNARDGKQWIRIPSQGAVIIGDDTEIGANATIDRGTLGSTIIGTGVKIDNLVMVAHNVVIGDNTAIAAQAGISGSTRIGNRVIIGGQAGFAGHIEIGDDAFIGAQSGVGKNVDKSGKMTGAPCRDLMTMRRIEACQMRLPELLKEVKRLRAEIDGLKDETKNRQSGKDRE
jgi:UDP-3-O-[3-hydroxymyristoyl] glucosamine N-acyltransferase